MFCVAIDPGSNGGIVEIDTDRLRVQALKMPETTRDILTTLCRYKHTQTMILLESQHARPNIIGKKLNPQTGKEELIQSRGTVATWSFAQHYGELRGIITALEIPFVEMRPQDWMKLAGVRKKIKGEKPTDWKRYLKERAQQMYPGTKVTLAVADALLMADVCHRLYGKDYLADPYADI